MGTLKMFKNIASKRRWRAVALSLPALKDRDSRAKAR
jgi:hypothetical protein